MMGFVDMFLEFAGDLTALLFGCPGSGATRHWGWGENFIAIGTLAGDGCPGNVVGHDECGHLVSHLTAAMVRAIFHVPFGLSAQNHHDFLTVRLVLVHLPVAHGYRSSYGSRRRA